MFDYFYNSCIMKTIAYEDNDKGHSEGTWCITQYC